MSEKTPLFAEFQPPSYEEWHELTVKSLRGTPFEALLTDTYEGIELQPIYRQEDAADIAHQYTVPGKPPFVRGADALGYLQTPWGVAQESAHGTPADANAALRHDLERGQTVANLVVDGPTGAGMDPDQAAAGEVGKGGLSLASAADLRAVLAGVDLTQTGVILDGGAAALPLAALLAASQEEGALNGWIDNDPLGALAQAGELPASLTTLLDEMAALTSWAVNQGSDFGTIAVHGDIYAEAGGSAIQELAFALATGVFYIREMQTRGLDIDVIAPHMNFVFGLGNNFFMEMAKLRAARLLWSQIVEAFGGSEEAQKMTIHARTAAWNKTATDPYVNLLRTTTEAFAGAASGVQSMHVAPFDAAVRPADEFARRIARNQQIVLQEEASLAKIIDPVGGSWYVEWLTDQVARLAWSLFQYVEEEGGMLSELKSGGPQEMVSELAEERTENIATGEDVLVGVNKYANAQETPLTPDATDYVALYAARVADVGAQRANVDHDAKSAALDKLATEKSVDATIAAASTGAILGEIAGALRGDGGESPSIVPLVPFHAER